MVVHDGKAKKVPHDLPKMQRGHRMWGRSFGRLWDSLADERDGCTVVSTVALWHSGTLRPRGHAGRCPCENHTKRHGIDGGRDSGQLMRPKPGYEYSTFPPVE